MNDLVKLELRLWNRIDERLRKSHDLPLAFFWPMYVIGRSADSRSRIGELATSLGLTVGGMSKIVDRIERIGLLRREPDATDRRASRVVLTDDGKVRLEQATATYEAEMASILDAALDAEHQDEMHRLVRSLLDATSSHNAI